MSLVAAGRLERNSAREFDRSALLLISLLSIAAVGVAASRDVLTGAGVLVGIAAFVAVLRRPLWGGYAVAGVVPITSGLARGVPVPGLRVSEALVVMVGVAVLGFASRRESPRFTRFDWLFLAYAVGSVAFPLAHLALQGRSADLGQIGSLFLPLQFFLIYRIMRTALRTDSQRVNGIRVLLGSSVIVCALAILQQLNVGPTRRLMIQLTDADALQGYAYEFFARATGPFQHWHPLAGYLTVILLVAIALLMDDRQKVLGRPWLIATLLLAGAAMMLSVTFTSMFAVVAGAVVLGIWSGRTKQTLMWTAFAAVAAVALFGSFLGSRLEAQYAPGSSGLIPQTVVTRFDVWANDYLPAMGGNWFAGWGVGLPSNVLWTHTESGYITVLLRGGLPLLALFVASMLVLTARALVRRTNPVMAGLAAVALVAWIMNLLYPYATSSGMAQPMWVLAGIALGMLGQPTNAGTGGPSPGESRKVRETEAVAL